MTNDSESVMSMNKIVRTFTENDRIFSSQVTEFIKEYNLISEFKDLPNIIDIESYSKQFIQKSKPLDSQDKWNLYKLLKEKDLLPVGFRLTEDKVFEYIRIIAEFLNDVRDETSAFEEERFNEVEIAINRIIYERQRKGIAVDVNAAKLMIQILEESVYNLKNRLQQEHRIFLPENPNIQREWLKGNDIDIAGSIERTFKNYSGENPVCNLFYELIRNQKDLNSFIDILAQRGGKSRAFPCFYGFGTITSRITLREPALQNIRKSNRVIIKPDLGYKFIYIDYSQFEAGILASLSGDKKLIKLYNEDIYKDMALNIYYDEKKRDEAKKLFYRFMYGDSKLNSNVRGYFAKFTKLKAYKKKIEQEAIDNMLVGTAFGNYRNVKDNINISLSHNIQATASLIFKKALIRVSEEVPEAEFVLPMHDAALFQVKRRSVESISNKIKAIFLKVFSEHCPEISPSVNEGEFYKNN
jgi:DNA polymerase I-like protein with 3'-5' exonuclease and polymerase domains